MHILPTLNYISSLILPTFNIPYPYFITFFISFNPIHTLPFERFDVTTISFNPILPFEIFHITTHILPYVFLNKKEDKKEITI